MSYNNSFASCYDVFMKDAAYLRRTEYIHDILKKNGIKSGILLDLACGTGNFSVNFSNLGYDVIGVDYSTDMLMNAKQNAVKYSKKEILFLYQDMTELDLFGTVDCCICCLDSLNHIPTKDGFEKAINNVSLFMNKGGIFIFDVNTLYKHKKILAERTFVYENENTFLTWQNSECKKGTVNFFLDIFSKKENEVYLRESEEFSETAYNLFYIKNVLKKSGFELINCYDDLTFRVPKPTSSRVYFVAKKV